MQRKILIYGHGDKSKKGFETLEEFRSYISGEIFSEVYNGRYRYSQRKDADIIVLTRDGLAHGYFVIASPDEPTEKDRDEYPKVKGVYIVQESNIYNEPVPISNLGISRYQFGKYITEEQFSQINDSAAGTRRIQPRR